MSVCVAWCDPGQVLGSFAEDSVALIVAGALNREVTHWIRLEHGPVLDLARNKLTERFLATDADWLLMLDTDMGFSPDLVTRLLAVADPEERPVIGALCFGLNAEQGVFPTAYRVKDGRFWIMTALPVEPFRVDATGAAVILIHRSVFDKITAEVTWPGRWWDRVYYGGEPVGEDLSFCLRCKEAGVPIWIEPRVPIAHYKLRLPIDRKSWEATQGQP